MSRSAGSKRKLANIAESSVSVPPFDADSFLQSIDAEVDAAIATIKEGTHTELVKRAEALNRAKENKIAAADRHRKMQIKNINAQYEYEVEDAGALYNKAYTEVQEEMIQDFMNERARLKNVHKQAMAANKKRGAAAGGGGGGADDDGNYLSNANQIISKSLASINNGPSGTTNGTGTRSLRSTATAEQPAPGEYVSADSKLEQLFNRNNANNNNNGSSSNNNGRGDIKDNISISGASTLGAAAALLGGGPTRRKKIPTTANGTLPLDQVLSESSMRSDFLEIVRDLQARAEAFEKTKPKTFTKEVTINEDYSELKVGTDVYSIGDYVNVFSVLSQETLSGVITAISHNEVIVRLGAVGNTGGSRVSFTVGHLKSGRVVLSRDSEMNEQNELLQRVAGGGGAGGGGATNGARVVGGSSGSSSGSTSSGASVPRFGGSNVVRPHQQVLSLLQNQIRA